MDPRAYWIGFNKIKGIGSVRTKKLLDYFGDLETAWKASANELAQAGIRPSIIEAIINNRQNIELESELKQINDLGINIVTLLDDGYPLRLKSIDQPPPVLFYKGDISCVNNYAIAIVGTRQKSDYGKQVTKELSNFLVHNGITVVSGLARGIDSIAHQAALDAGGSTIAVMGCGVDIVYPPEHRTLYNQIQEMGLVVSDYPPGTQPEGINFPPRNRIISGLSMATVVVEAGERSGALITAEFALNQGREVFAVPGPIFAPHSKGTNRLIRDGAIPLNDYEDILNLLNLDQINEFRYAKKIIPENEIESLLYDTMKNDAMHINDIKSATGLSMEKVSAALVMMELKGLVKQIGNMIYISIGESSESYEAR